MKAAKRFLRAGFRSIVGLYFRDIEVVGDRPSAATRGRVFISNHSNALIDPILVLTHAPCDVSPLAKSTLWKIPGLPYLLDIAEAVPVHRRRDDPEKPAGANDEIFDKIAQHLAAGGNVLVFPEGTSHNEPQMLRLKTGAARMIERARALGAKDLTFQTVGLEFDRRHGFRSRAVVAYGPVRSLDAFPVGAVDAVTAAMRDDLAELVVEAATWDERRLVMRIAELLRNESGDLSFAEAVRIAQLVERARDELRAREPELARATEESLRTYFDALESAAATDDQLARETAPSRIGKPVENPLAWLSLPLAPLGVALYWVPYQLPRLVAARTDEVDQHSTLKLATGLVAYPVWAGVLTAAALAVLRSRPAKLAAVATIFASPFAALYWKEHFEELRRAARFEGREALLRDLQSKRAAALETVGRARAILEPPDVEA